jgi:hypothetical protein
LARVTDHSWPAIDEIRKPAGNGGVLFETWLRLVGLAAGSTGCVNPVNRWPTVIALAAEDRAHAIERSEASQTSDSPCFALAV